jgi:GNAT superfamily N-acetyltransferase
MNIQYRNDYFDDPIALAAFEEYAKTIFGVDFERWRDKGLWDPEYVAFSAFDDARCVASICVYPSDIVFNGHTTRWAQLLTVGTLPEYRRKGIQRELWIRASAWVNKRWDMVFLFTDDEAAGFYEKLGLKRQVEHFDVTRNLTGALSDDPDIRKLDLDNEDDYAIVRRLAFEREPVSNVLGFHCPRLLLFMFLYAFQDCTYYIEHLDTIAVVEQTESSIRIHDVVATTMPLEKDLEAALGTFKAEEVHWLFCTDRLMLSPLRKERVTEDVLIVSPNFETSQKLVFSHSIRA